MVDELPDKDKDILLEQYKLYVGMADEISKRRAEANRFFITLVGGGLAAVSVFLRKEEAARLSPLPVLVVALLGIVLCANWRSTIVSYKRLNSGKFRVIHEMEVRLPFAPYDREWAILNPQNPNPKRNRYRRLSDLEAYVPLVIAAGYLVVGSWAVVSLVR